MQLSSLIIVAAFSSVALAQSITDLPTCARTCVGGNFGGCSLLDVKCICSNADYISNLSCCIAEGCSADDQAKTIKFASDLCVGVGITVATSATCTSTSAPAGSSSGTPSASTTASSSHSSGPSPSGSSSSGSVTRALTSLVGTNALTTGSAGAATAGSTGAAPLHTAGSGVGVGLGLAMAGLLVAM